MCDDGELTYDDGWDAGFENGWQAGYEEGYEAAVNSMISPDVEE